MKVTERAIKTLHKEFSNIADFYTDEELRAILADTKRHPRETIADAFLHHEWHTDTSLHGTEVRRCDHCGNLMNTGYYLSGVYACSDECRNAIYMDLWDCKSVEEAEKDYEKDYEEDEYEFYYTEWL